MKKAYYASFNEYKQQDMKHVAGDEVDKYDIEGLNVKMGIRVRDFRATVMLYHAAEGVASKIVRVSVVCGEIMNPIREAMEAQRIADIQFLLAQILPQPIAEEVCEYI
jgi:hypothetical protein